MNIKQYLPVVVCLLVFAGISACSADTPVNEQPITNEQATASPDDLLPTKTPFPSSTPLVTWTPLPTNTIDPNPSSTPANISSETRYINTTSPSVNVRDGAGVSFGVVGSIANGTQIKVVGQQTTSDGYVWYEIIYLSGTAWIYSDLTSLTRPSLVQTLPTQVPVPVTSNCSCSGADLDCSNFGNSVDAQACYNKCMVEVGWDYHRLDGDDNDGWVCEMFP